MLDSIGNTIRDLFGEWNKLSGARKAAAGAVGAIVIGSLVALGMWVGETSYSPLYTNLQPGESIELVKTLQAENIPYMVSNDGATISIPPEFVQGAMMKLAVKGISGGQKPGMELFDKESFGTSNYVQRINYLRAIQGELIRTITTLKAVRKSDVHISLPPKQSFLEVSEEPKASVVVELHPGMDLVRQEVRGIQQLVAGSVERLRPERVTVVDNTGKILSESQDAVGAVTMAMMEYQKHVEADLERKVSSIVGRIVGEGKVVARVTAELDFNRASEKQVTYDPEGAVAVSSDKQENNMQGVRPIPGGTAGAQGAIPGPSPASEPTATASQRVDKVDEKNRFAVSSKTRAEEKALGQIKRLSVSVLVDDERVKAQDGTETTKPLSEERKTLIAKLVRDAVGFVPNRDSVTIESAPFAQIDLETADEFIKNNEWRKLVFTLVQYGTIAVFILLFFFFIVRPFMKWVTGLSSSDVTKILPKTVEELEIIQEPETDAIPGMANLPLFEERVDVEKAESELIRDKILSLIQTSPAKAALIVSDWLNEGGTSGKGKGKG